MKGVNWDDPAVEWTAVKLAAASDAYRMRACDESFQFAVSPQMFHDWHRVIDDVPDDRCPVCYPWDCAK